MTQQRKCAEDCRCLKYATTKLEIETVAYLQQLMIRVADE